MTLEIDERYHSLDQKWRSLQDAVELFLEISQGPKDAAFGDYDLVVLIFCEIAMTFFRG